MSLRLRLMCAVVFVLGCGKPIPPKVESGFTMAKDSMSFANFAAGYEDATMDADSMQKMFGTGVCKSQSSPCELTLGATAFMNKANKAMQGGRCEGFAVLSSMMHAGKVKAVDFGGESARDLILKDNSLLQRELAYWFSTQLLPSVVEKTKGYSAKDVMQVLAAGLAKDAKERYRIGIVKKNGDTFSGGHALTPISYYPGEKEGIYLLQVYDNNIPDKTRTMRIDTKANRWEYEASENPQRKPSLYFGDDSNKNLLYLAPIFTRIGSLPCHFCDGTSTQITTSGGVQVVANGTGVSGGSMSASDGNSVTPTFTATNDDDGASFNIILKSATGYTLAITGGDKSGTDSESATIDIAGPNFNVRASNLNVESTDGWKVSGDGREQTFTNESKKPITLSGTVLNDGNTVSVSASVDGTNDSISTNIKADGKVEVDAKGANGSTITVEIEVTTSQGEKKSGTLSFTSQGDAKLTSDANEVAMTGIVTGTVINNGMMQQLGDSCTDGKVSGTESDIDCGGTCDQKCGVTQKCAAAADCASNFCAGTSKTCVATQCEDELKSGDETDVDCGGATCAKCSVGKACGSTLDCAQGLTCDNSVCKNSYLIKVAVSGLPTTGAVELTNATNNDVLTITSNDTVPFAARTIGQYSVSITKQPFNANCVLMNGSGTAAADVTLNVTCTPTFGISGSVSGLEMGKSVTLINNGGDAQTVSSDGPFAFSTRVTGAYLVTVQTQPAGQTCVVMSGSGTATGNVSNVSVACGPAGFTIGGTVTGLPPTRTVTLLINGVDPTPVPMDGPFAFPGLYTNYTVTVGTQPVSGNCTVTNDTGTASANVSNVTVTCVNTSGTLDTSFNGTGFFSQSPNGFHNEFYRVAVNPDNSVVWVGRNQVGGADEDWVIAKFTAGGTLDNTFGTGGFLGINRGGAIGEKARAIHRNTDGSYLVAGTFLIAGNGFDFGVAKVTASGALDGTFGTAGVVTHDVGMANDVLNDMKVLSDGTMILAGTTNGDFLVMKLNADGTLDTTFATNGHFIIASPADEAATAVDVKTTTGDIFAAGYSNASGNYNTLLVSLNAFGVPNPMFAAGGVIDIDLSGNNTTDQATDIDLESGNPTLVGFAAPTGSNDYTVAQFDNFTGMPTTLGGTGTLLIDRGSADVARAIRYIPSTGGFMVAGNTGANASVFKLNNAGLIDTSFGNAGHFQNQMGGPSAVANDLAFDSNNKIVIGGSFTVSGGNNPDFGAGRLNP